MTLKERVSGEAQPVSTSCAPTHSCVYILRAAVTPGEPTVLLRLTLSQPRFLNLVGLKP